jgi:pyruvate/2-oxoglutarate dehydrogenase complex dihydrolipoamide dehydrogenase (E3) component
MATKVRGVYAAGDVTGRLPFTHAADEMGRLAAGNALGKGQRSAFRARWIPWVTFTEPEVGRVGMTEAEAAGHGGRVAYLPLGELDRAITDGRTDGYIKLVAGPKRVTRRMFGGRIIGATIVAPRAGEMIHEPALAMRAGMFVGRLAQTVHAYPTWSMGIQQAAAQFFGDVDGRTARPARS